MECRVGDSGLFYLSYFLRQSHCLYFLERKQVLIAGEDRQLLLGLPMRRQFLLLSSKQVIERICKAHQGGIARLTSFFWVTLCAKIRKSASKVFLEEILNNQLTGCYFF